MKERKLADLYRDSGISSGVYEFGEAVLTGLKDRFEEIDRTAEYNQVKVLNAFRSCRVSEACLMGTTGYGYNDIGRDTLEAVYASVFGTEAALVRPLIACGTHALAIALFGNLRPGDELLSISGSPYDTLEEVIGIRPSAGSLAEYGVRYVQAELTEDGDFDYKAIEKAVTPATRVAAIQRSRGYSSRPTLSVQKIGEAVRFIKSLRPDIICMVDNCYGEFTEREEPSDLGADMVVGSLIKNPGGGLAPSGGYICGTRTCIENASYRMTCPGLGAEIGPTMNLNTSFFQGFFLAPTVTASALKASIFAANLYERLGFPVRPGGTEKRHDIIQAVELGTPERLQAFCAGIQKGSPVDSFVSPEPWDMPGYDDQVIMAAGAFISGSSIELSADGPMRPPYTAFFQGGLTWPSAKYGILMSLEALKEKDLIRLPGENN